VTRYQKFLVLAFLAVWIWGAVNPKYPGDWLLENYVLFIFVSLIFLLGRFFRLSNLSYSLITVFMSLHVVGAHYTYGQVPFGYALQSWLGSDRNMYDRLVHFSFGFLLAYPIREVCLRVSKVKGLWGYYFPFDVIISFSAIYEIAEWLAAATLDPAAGIAFLGTQGDIWDSQKDMLSAGTGALIALLVIALVNFRYSPVFWNEIKESLHLSHNDKPRGEVRLAEMIKRRFNG